MNKILRWIFSKKRYDYSKFEEKKEEKKSNLNSMINSTIFVSSSIILSYYIFKKFNNW